MAQLPADVLVLLWDLWVAVRWSDVGDLPLQRKRTRDQQATVAAAYRREQDDWFAALPDDIAWDLLGPSDRPARAAAPASPDWARRVQRWCG